MTTDTASPPPKQTGPRRRPRVVRTSEVIGWFIGVFCTYWIYWLVAVPLIEPGIEPETVSRYTASTDGNVAPTQSQRKQSLAQFFPPGAWELDNPAVWETDQTLLLFKLPPTSQPSKTIRLQHCTLLYFPNDRADAQRSAPRPVIMRAENGASLEFDDEVRLKNADFSKLQLVGGMLHGRIRIERKPRAPGADDDLLITTRDITLRGDVATSPHEVNFRLGRSQGSGRELEIQLQNDGNPGGGLRSGKIKALLIKKDVVMNLASTIPPSRRDGRQNVAGDLSGSTLRITCNGRFQYTFDQHAAAFHDRVDVARLGSGPVDQLNCELLTVFFRANDAAGQPAAAAEAGAAAADDQPIRRIEARGDPVTMHSPSRGIYVKSHHGLDFEPLPNDQLGRMVGLGQGVMQGVAPGENGGKFLVRWTREFRFEPAENGQFVASLHGAANVRMPGMGEITADDQLDAQGKVIQEGAIFAWATRVTAPKPSEQVAVRPVALQQGGAQNPGAGADKWQIERLLAQGHVQVNTPQLDAETRKIEVWVERPTAPPPGAAPLAGAAPAEPAPTTTLASTARSNAPPAQRFSVHAGGVQVKLVPNGEDLAVASLTLENQAHLQELNPKPGTQPMVVAGERLHVAGANTEQMHVTVAGNLAQIQADGLMLLGQTIELERHTNRLWVDGAGQMIMPLTQDLNGKPLSQPQTAKITWDGGMHFQTDTVTFERNVRVMSAQQLLTAPKLVARLDRPVDFSNPQLDGPPGSRTAGQNGPQLAFVQCHGLAVLEGTQLDEQGQRTSTQQMQVIDLSIDRATGDVRGKGPGSIHYVGITPAGAGPGGLALPGQPQRPQAADRPKQPFTAVHVEFSSTMSGNINRRTITFGDQTQTAYAPVATWNANLDPEKPESLGPDGMVVDARQLTVRQMPPRMRGEEGWFELVAEGNVLAEGSTFVAIGHRTTYSQDKDHLVLEGDGRSPAELSYSPIPGGPRTNTQVERVVYNVGKRHVVLSGTGPLNFQAPARQPQPRAN